MGNQTNDGLHITPLTMAALGLLWTVLAALITWNLLESVDNGKRLERLADVKERVDDHEARIRVLERVP